MARVRAALETDAIDNHEEDELHIVYDHEISQGKNKRSSLQEVVGRVVDPNFIPSEVNGIGGFRREEKHAHSFVPLDKSATKSILRQFEELLYMSELEEELLQRNVLINRPDGYDCLPNVIISEENKGRRLRTPIISAERQHNIKEYATIRCRREEKRFDLLTKNGELQYDDIVEQLAETILERIIEDIAGELEEHIEEETGTMVSNV